MRGGEFDGIIEAGDDLATRRVNESCEERRLLTGFNGIVEVVDPHLAIAIGKLVDVTEDVG